METENLLGMLFGQMNAPQQLRFKQAIVAQTIHYVSQRLPVAAQDQGERGLIALANQWITQPTTESDDALKAVSSQSVAGQEYASHFLAPVQAASAVNGYEAVIYALIAAGEWQVAGAKQWQMAAAWDILADRTPPPFEVDF
jgi:hypothetical protein